MAKKRPLKLIQKTSARFCNIRHANDLAKLVAIEPYKLQMIAANPQYNIFSVPKKNGQKRWIEDPLDDLQAVQDKLAFYLGAVYYLHKTAAAYGFIISVKKEEDPRHIVSNAQQHLGKAYLFNADMKDFFHQVKAARLEKVFDQAPFNFKTPVIDLLVRLCTNQGRLPMGAPTSPVLSNFASIEMDKELLQLAQWAEWRYTRYADDLSFSSDTAFKPTEVEQIQGIVEAEGFVFNPNKYHFLGPTDNKVITGVQLAGDHVVVPGNFLRHLKLDLKKLAHVIEVAHRMGKREKWIERFRQQVAGKINFVSTVVGEEDPVAESLLDAYDEALHPPDDFGAMSWLDFGYF